MRYSVGVFTFWWAPRLVKTCRLMRCLNIFIPNKLDNLCVKFLIFKIEYVLMIDTPKIVFNN